MTEVHHLERMRSSSIAIELAVRGWLDLKEKGLSDGFINLHSDLRAIVAYTENGRDTLPAGVVIWEMDEVTKVAWVTLSYVLPEFRGAGIYSTMWSGLVETAVKIGAVRIESATHVRNQAMRAIAARQGRREEAVVLRYDIQR